MVISEEAAKFANIPAFDQGVQILQAIERVKQRVERIQQTQTQMQQTQVEMQLSMQQMSDRFETRSKASYVLKLESLYIRSNWPAVFLTRNRNTIARTQNSVVAYTDRKLAPLVNSLTSEDIENFPDTAISLGRIHGTTINRILLVLEYGTAGSMEERRDRLREAIGLKIGGA